MLWCRMFVVHFAKQAGECGRMRYRVGLNTKNMNTLEKETTMNTTDG